MPKSRCLIIYQTAYYVYISFFILICGDHFFERFFIHSSDTLDENDI